MKQKKLKRKLRKRALKLYEFARKNGIEHLTEFVMLDNYGEDYVNLHVETMDGEELRFAAFPEMEYETWR